MGFGDKLRQYRKENDLEQKELAQIIGVSKQTISAYEVRGNCPTYTDFIKICNTLEVDANYFMQEDLKYIKNPTREDEQKILSSYRNLSDSDRRVVDFILGLNKVKTTHTQENKQTIIYRLPVYNQDVAAGSGKIGIEQTPDIEEFYFDNLSEDISYGIRIKGNSMETEDDDNIPNNCTVLITTNFDLNYLEKEAVIVNINGTLICKEYNIAEDGHLWLKSRNPQKSNEDKHIYDMSNIKILGKVVMVVAKN